MGLQRKAGLLYESALKVRVDYTVWILMDEVVLWVSCLAFEILRPSDIYRGDSKFIHLLISKIRFGR